MLDLQSLRYSVLVAEHQSFRKAALAIGVRQSAVSRRIRSLEDAIGVSIFQRFSGGVRLTHAGIEFISAVRTALDEIDLAISTAAIAGRGEGGRLTIGFRASLSKGALRDAMVEYARRYPGVTIHVSEGGHRKLTVGIKSQAIDIAVVAGEINGTMSDAMLLWSERIMVALSEGHALAARTHVFWQDLKGEPLLRSHRDPDPEIQDDLIARLAISGERPTIISHDVSRESILTLIGTGRGVSLLYESATGSQYPGVVYREVHTGDGPMSARSVAYWSHTNDNPALRRFLSLLRERYPARSGFAAGTAGD